MCSPLPRLFAFAPLYQQPVPLYEETQGIFGSILVAAREAAPSPCLAAEPLSGAFIRSWLRAARPAQPPASWHPLPYVTPAALGAPRSRRHPLVLAPALVGRLLMRADLVATEPHLRSSPKHETSIGNSPGVAVATVVP